MSVRSKVEPLVEEWTREADRIYTEFVQGEVLKPPRKSDRPNPHPMMMRETATPRGQTLKDALDVEQYRKGKIVHVKQIFGGDVAGGVCNAVCRVWAKKALSGGVLGAEGPGRMSGLQAGCTSFQMIKGMQAADAGNKVVAGAELAGYRERSRGFFGGPLSSRNKILDHVLGARGVYIFWAFQQDLPFGHAMAFDTRAPHLYFMDPNVGQFWIKHVLDEERKEKETFFRGWYRRYWDMAGYKGHFHKGNRKLYRYVSASQAI